jgi:hypothetical protein
VMGMSNTLDTTEGDYISSRPMGKSRERDTEKSVSEDNTEDQ